MITIYPYETLGRANHGWLDARHHFSFAQYHNPQRMGFGLLRVVNDDIIKAGSGFDTHPHRDMEIITYIRQGAITHRDSRGNAGRTVAGDVQVMSAGTGIQHSEFNREDEDTILYQIWIEPNRMGVEPRWDQRRFPRQPVTEALPLLVSGSDDEALSIYQDAQISGGRLNADTRITHPIRHQLYLLASDGELQLNGQRLNKGDAAEVTGLAEVTISAVTNAEVLVIDIPAGQ